MTFHKMTFHIVSGLGNPNEKIREDMNELYSSLDPNEKNEYLHYGDYNYNEEMSAYTLIYDSTDMLVSMAHACKMIQNDKFFVVFLKFATHELFRNRGFAQKCIKQVIIDTQTLKPEPWIFFIYNEDNHILQRINQNLGFKNVTILMNSQSI